MRKQPKPKQVEGDGDRFATDHYKGESALLHMLLPYVHQLAVTQMKMLYDDGIALAVTCRKQQSLKGHQIPPKLLLDQATADFTAFLRKLDAEPDLLALIFKSYIAVPGVIDRKPAITLMVGTSNDLHTEVWWCEGKEKHPTPQHYAVTGKDNGWLTDVIGAILR